MTGLAERVPVPVVRVDGDGRVRWANATAESYFGEDAAVGASLRAVVADGDVDAFDELLAVDDERERRVRFEFADGTRYPTVNAAPDGDDVALVVDPASERTGDGEFVQGIVDPMYVLDERGVIVGVNDALVETYGYEREELVGEHATEIMPEAAFERGTEKVRELLDGEADTATLEFRATRADGTTGWAEANVAVLTDADGGFDRTVGVIRDVTERKRRERELADFETIAESAPVGMFTVDEDGRVTWANWRLYDRLGMSQDELVGRPVLELVEEGFVEPEMVDRYTEFVRDLLSDDVDVERADHEERLHPPDGETLTVEAHTTLLPLDEDGRFTGTVNAFRDVTKRKAYREELERQNERLATFASVVSHDLRNPLTVAAGHLANARTRHPDDDDLVEVERSLGRMNELVDDLLTLARDGDDDGDREAVDLETAARRAWATVDTGDATLAVDVDGVVSADESRLRQLFENLFRNAIEHNPVTAGEVAPNGGDGSAESGDGVTVTVTRTKDGFAVVDDGVGLPDDVDVFALGASTNDGGTGLGLAIVADVVDAHGWTIEATDAADGGARFAVGDVDVRDDD